MSRKDKLYESIKEGPSNVTLKDLLQLMKDFGFEAKKVRHGYIFKHENLRGDSLLPHVANPHDRENKVLGLSA